MISELQQDHEVIITCRSLANTIGMLNMLGLPYHEVGCHYGANRIKKGVGFLIRVSQLYGFLKKQKIDVAISHSSFYSPVVARLLRIRSIYLNDNEHAAGNKISFMFATTILVPEFFMSDKCRRQSGYQNKIVQYPGVKEGIYLADFKQNSHIVKPSKLEIFIRPEPWTAQYYRGSVNFLDNLILGLQDKYNIILMPRDDKQAEHYTRCCFHQGVTIPSEPLTLEAVAVRCSLFIGAGGTMTREAAVLGIPTISVYQSELLAVDRYLIDKGFMIHKPSLTSEFVDSFLHTTQRKPPSDDLLRKGSEAAHLIKDILLNQHNVIPEAV